MSTPAEYLRRGIYVDYGRPWGAQTQYLCKTSSATLWTTFLGILVSLAIARLFRLVLRLYQLVRSEGSSRIHKTPEAIIYHQLLDWLGESRPGAHQLPGQSSDIRYKTPGEAISITFKAFLLSVTFASILVCGTLTAKLATSGRAVSHHPACGVYIFTMVPPLYPEVSSYFLDLSIEGAQLADGCYNAKDPVIGCNLFLRELIPYNTSTANCPFADKTICLDEGAHVIQYSTGLVDGRILGINAPKTAQFMKNATCSPIIVNETFTRTSIVDGMYRTEYYYGPNKDSPFTLSDSTPVNFIDRDPHYKVGITVAPSEWTPIPALNVAHGSQLSLFFINQKGVSYPQPCKDPIFKTEERLRFSEPTGSYERFISKFPESRIIGCVETIQIRHSDWPSGWHSINDMRFNKDRSIPSDLSQNAGGVQLLTFSLLDSYMAITLAYRQGSGLIASKSLRGTWSGPISNEQWKLETTKMFETSLTLIPINVRNLARGTKANYGATKARIRSNVCRDTFIFMSQGWQNINVAGSVWILSLCFLCVLLAIPVEEDALLAEPLWRGLILIFSEYLPALCINLSQTAGPYLQNLCELSIQWLVASYR